MSSSSNRWIIPKGDIDEGLEPHLAAEKEAFEEGGVRGRIDPHCLGTFGARKEENGAAIVLDVAVYPLEVEEELECWPEMDRRTRCWLPVGEAAEAVGEPELAAILKKFAI